MLYHLLAPLARQHIFFNLFNYITFRAAGATVTALLLAFIVGPWIIRKLQEHKIGQIVRAEGPASHHGKRGTPTMGGLMIILATVVPTLLWARLDSRYVIVALVATLWMGLIGFLDDYLKIVRGQSQGLVARWKLVGQVAFGIGLGVYLLVFPLTNSVAPNATQLPFFKYYTWILAWPIYLGFVTFVTTASSNAVNLTDGLDGLAAGLTVIAGGAFAHIQDRHFPAPHTFDQRRNAIGRASSRHEIYQRRIIEDARAFQLSDATHHADNGLPSGHGFPNFADAVIDFLRCSLAHRTGVEEHYVSHFRCFSQFITGLPQTGGSPFGVSDVHLTTHRFNVNSCAHSPGQSGLECGQCSRNHQRCAKSTARE